MIKHINGRAVECTPEEEAAIREQWASNDGLQKWVPLKIEETKREAQKRIFEIVPGWKQNNLTARAIELLRKQLSGPLTEAEQAEFAAGLALWERVKAVRTASDLIEQDILESADPKALDVSSSRRWP